MIPIDSLLGTLRLVLVHGAAGVALGASAWAFGETILRRLGIDRRAGRWALAGCLGWGLIVQALFFLGIMDLLERRLVLVLLALAHLACLGTWRSLFESRPGRRQVLGCLIAAPFFLMALYPPTGFDATVYHLPYARAFIDAGGLEFLPDLRFPVFPQAGEMGFVLGFFLSGEIAARLTQLLATLLTAGLLLAWGRLYDRRAGIWAAALWLGNPLVAWIGTGAYVDATLALFVSASFYAWERWSRDGDRHWLWLAGVFVGLAAGTKYLGLFFLAALAALTARRALERRAGLRPPATLAAAALALLAPWYLRIMYHTGSPIFPFYAPIFGASEWATLHDQALPAASAETGLATVWAVAWSQIARVVEGLPFLALVPWTAVVDRGVFHWQAPLSPWYLALVPIAAPLALLERRSRRLILVVAVYGLFWLTTVRDLRFLLAGMPALNVALAATLAGPVLATRWTKLPGRHAALATPLLAALLLAPGVLYAGYKIHQQGRPPVGAEERRAYLGRQVPGYPAIATMNDLAGRDYTVYALYGENLRYYAEGRFLGDRFGPFRFSRVEAVLGDSRALADELDGLGACFLLLRHPRPRQLLPDDAESRRLFRERAAGEGFVLYRLPTVDCSREAPRLRTTPS